MADPTLVTLTAQPLQFTPFATTISPDFWHSLTTLKLQVLKLSDDPVPVVASYIKGRVVKDRTTGEDVGLGCGIELDGNSFQVGSYDTSAERVALPGMLRNFNTIEDFKNADKTALLESLANDVWARASSSEGDVTGAQLNPFLMLTFADLKKYRYWYWCGFPALLQKPGWEIEGEWQSMNTVLTPDEVTSVHERQTTPDSSFSLARPNPSGALDFGTLSSFATFFQDVHVSSRSLIFLDPSSHASACGWSLRNVLTYLAVAHSVSEIRLVSYRDTSDASSINRVAAVRLKSSGEVATGARPGVVGWEKNDKGKLGPRMADLAPLMDPRMLADQAVDLNLQLMRWRIMPALDLERVKHTKVLLLGAGTLGCYVARTLMAWGVRKITLVDSSTVSFSNPVRQPLFEFADSLDGGKPKAEAAAEALKRVYPGVDATGVTLSIPMPGHPIPAALIDRTKEDVKTLEQLIDSHDVVYLLMDSRESRWLPTVIGASKRKLVMNVALGFDTFLVMRHGLPLAEGAAEALPATVVPGQPYLGRLGCYYCNDIVAPMDSLTDRTLDQMCTVTRPGIAAIASSTAVELMVSVLQHPDGALARSDVPIASSRNPSDDPVDPATSSPLGIVPHQIRGYLAQFHNMKITGQAYDRCTGCSDTVIKAYEADGFSMLVQAFEDAKFLEKLTGLDKLADESEAMMDSIDWDEDDEEELSE